MPRIRQFPLVQRPVFALWLLVCFAGLRVWSALPDIQDGTAANDLAEKVLEQRADENHPGNLTLPQGAKDCLDEALPDLARGAVAAEFFHAPSLPARRGSCLPCRVLNRGPPGMAV
ncbi:MAG TPA: hypothetical protein DIT64_04660 [Verrucomicrobiales bacterium]|nr:hypothetical protein [Verrucomicrobiales bacterium]